MAIRTEIDELMKKDGVLFEVAEKVEYKRELNAEEKEIAEISDKLTRNEIASSNEIRQIIGWKPSQDPAADELRNKNLNQQSPDMMAPEDQMYKDPAAYEEGYEDPEVYDDSGQY